MQELFDPADTPELLAGLASPDDAAVWKLDEDRALVLTTDFFTPVVDDPFDYGRIAAANSLSDVYAMGAAPFLALNIAAFPPDLDPAVSGEIFRGGATVAKQAGAVIAGGHSIQDKEPKYGMVVAGIVDAQRMFSKGGAKPGDRLYLTKPLGFGTITTALKRQMVREEDLAEAVSWMVRLNREASRIGMDCGVRAATDITGYSFIGHALELANASGVGLRVAFERLPVLPAAFTYASQFIFPGGTYDNRSYFEPFVEFSRKLPDDQTMLLFDPQTSGGLLLAVPAQHCADFEAAMQQGSAPCWQVGEVIKGSGIIFT